METERNGFSIIGFIAQVLVILLFVFVLMWLFPTKSYIENNNNGVNNSNNANSEILFNQNLASMKDAAREYFTVSKLPKKVGESTTLTLGEMIDKSMVVELTDGNGKKCDTTASYVRVTKIDDEYEMIVTLTCSGVTKSIKTKLGCYNYCQSDICESEEEVTEILYQYKKTTEPTSKWSDWSKWSKNKVVPTSTKEVETKVVNEQTGTTTEITNPIITTVYSCPGGYTLSSDKKTCYKPTSSTSTIASTVTQSYSCPSGYTMSADKKTCSKTTSSTSTIASTVTNNYSCPDGYTLSNDKKTCTKITNSTSTVASTVTNNYSCATGTLNSNNKCERKVPVYGDVTYYRYRTYETIPAKTYIKWSTSSNDQKLINQGYKYTGVTKEVTSK